MIRRGVKVSQLWNFNERRLQFDRFLRDSYVENIFSHCHISAIITDSYYYMDWRNSPWHCGCRAFRLERDLQCSRSPSPGMIPSLHCDHTLTWKLEGGQNHCRDKLLIAFNLYSHSKRLTDVHGEDRWRSLRIIENS